MSGDTVLIITEDTPVVSVPVLWEGPGMDELPDGATLNADGSVTVTLAYPFTLSYRAAGSDQVAKSDLVETVTLHRLTGAHVRKMRTAKDPARAMISASARISAARLELWLKQMDAADETTLSEVVTAMLAIAPGLPHQAEDQGDAVELRLLFPRDDEEGGSWESLRFARMTAAMRRQMQEADDPLVWVICNATGLTPRVGRPLLDSMDGADVQAIARVLGFLGRSGRPTGG